MARPLKSGIDYFPLDVRFFDDRKIKELRGKFGADGITLYIYLLCLIYEDNGYYLKLDDGFNYVVSADLQMSSEKIGQIINFLCERSLFDNTLFVSDKVITSHGIQTRYQEAVKIRAAKKEIEVGEYWLLSESETKGYIKCAKFESFSEKNGGFSERNEGFSEEKPPKVKESKVKESNNIHSSEKSDERAKSDRIDYQSIIKQFNSVCTSLPKVTKLSDSRKTKIRTFLKEFTIDELYSVFTKAQQSDFLSGRSGRWCASFVWLINKTNAVKVLDGNYDNKGYKGREPAPSEFASGEWPWGLGGVEYE